MNIFQSHSDIQVLLNIHNYWKTDLRDTNEHVRIFIDLTSEGLSLLLIKGNAVKLISQLLL